jgi:hypothetical protein
MAFSGHKTLAEVQRYTEAANKKRLADSGAAKMQDATSRSPKLITDQRAEAGGGDAGSEEERHSYKRGGPKSTNGE